MTLLAIEAAIPTGRFVIYAGDDPTFHRQTDGRYSEESLEENEALIARLHARGALGVFGENLDTFGVGAVPLPTGVLPTMAM